MFPEVMERERAMQYEREKEHAIRLAKIAGVADPERRVVPELTATVRYGDPQLADLFEQQARNDLNEESITKLESEEPDMSDAPMTSLEEIDGVGPDLARNLEAAGYETPDDLREATDEELLAVDGVGPAKLKVIREDLS